MTAVLLADQEIPQFQVIRPHGSVHLEQGQMLLTRAQALRIARAASGKIWLVPHTPYSSPQAFDACQQKLFLQGLCCYVTSPRASGWSRYCQDRCAPRADYGYCARHKNE